MSKKKTTEQFIADALKVHSDEGYTYDKVDYQGNKIKVVITCPIHGDFKITPNSFLSGQGCKDCGIERARQKNTMDKDTFIQRVNEVHGDKYDVSQCNYVNALTITQFVCKEHGPFNMTPAHLLEGHGCKECAKEARRQKRSQGFDEFVRKANIVHNNFYGYNDTNYVNNKTPIMITCPIHGDFPQRPDDHLAGKGCSSCGHVMSKAEKEIYEYVCSLIGKENVIHEDNTILDNLEIDIYVPSMNFGIEFNGLHWHTEEFGKDRNYHLDKTKNAAKKGVTLIHIFEDEWIEHKDLVLDKITHALHKDNGKIKIGARKCNIRLINKHIAEDFLNKYHIQGYVGSSKHYGAYYGDILVGVMSFKEESKEMWNLTRFTTDYNYAIPGLANKLFKCFLKENNVKEVKTFLDRRWSWSKVNVYDRMGFMLEKIEAPDYRYVVGEKRMHKFGFRKAKLSKTYGLPISMSESEMTKKLGFQRIWDCGLIKYVWRKSSNDISNIGIGYRFVDDFLEVYCDATQIYNNQRSPQDDIALIEAVLKEYGNGYKVIEYDGDYSGGTNFDDLPLRVRYLTNLTKETFKSK